MYNSYVIAIYIAQTGCLTYAVLGSCGSRYTAVQLKRKKEHWDVPIGVQPYGDRAINQSTAK